ncbi:phytoene/squalene synthase family protein [candidate division KSB1 bacterium]|nr:phytoene/squalene synthase family protein [candidate division KSB1 bacterium]
MQLWKKSEFRPAFVYARRLTKEYSKSFYMSSQLFPRNIRWATYTVYGFCRYVDNLADNPRHRSNKELLNEVNCFERELKIAYRTGESEHPILKSFIPVMKQYHIPLKYPLDLINGVRMDIMPLVYETFDDLYLFCYRVASVVGLMMTHIMGYSDDSAFIYAEKLGIAMQLTNILRDVQEDKDMNRIYIPRAEMQRFGVAEHDIIYERFSENVRRLIHYQVERAHQYYEEAQPGIRLLSPHSRFAIYSASRIYRGILYKLEHRNYNPFLGRVFVPGSQKMQILAREYVKTKLRYT